MKCASPASTASQRGAIGLTAILILLMTLLLTALVVDSGRLWLLQKRLQSTADLAAIHAGRHLGCNTSLQSVTQAAQSAALNNGFNGQLSATPNQVLLGRLNTVQGVRQFIADGSNQAIYVKATQVVPSSLVTGGLLGGRVTLQAEAVSVSDPSLATFRAGSFTTNLGNQQSALLNGLLGAILGAPLNLDVLTYRGIANTVVTLQDLLAVAVQIGSVESLLNTTVQVGDLLELVANAADRNGLADVSAISGMRTIAALSVNNATLKLGDVIAVSSPNSEAAATISLNALSLIITTAMIANGSHAISLPLSINVPSIAQVTAQINIIEPPQLAVGPAAGEGAMICTQARTAQLRTSVAVLVDLPLLARIDLALGIEVAQGAAGLRSIQHDDDTSTVSIEATPGIAAVRLTNNAGTGPSRISTLLGIPLADIGLNLPIQPGSPQTLEYVVTHPVRQNLPQTQSVSSSLSDSLENALSQPDAISVSLLGGVNLGVVNTLVSTVVGPLLSEIARTLLDPLLELLGIRVGGLDVTVDDMQYRQAKPLVL